MQFTAGQIQLAISAEVSGSLADTRVTGWSIDSRTVAPGDLFFAIPGDKFDGHGFVPAALAQGAAGAVVSQAMDSSGGLLLRVPDTIAALQQLAQWARRVWDKPIAAVTGSAGKTTTKDIVAALLSTRFRAAKTIGNFNNHIGLPLSVLRIPDEAEMAVLEMGMNHAGEIRGLCRIAAPQVGVVTNVGYAHIENFDSLAGIAAAKCELIDALAPGGAAVLNADDPYVCKFHPPEGVRRITYGLTAAAEVRAEHISFTPGGSEFMVGGVRFECPLRGRHGILNVLAGIAAAEVFGIAAAELVDTVAALTPGKMRGERHEWNGITVLDDSYNSNPEAARGMLDVLRTETSARRIAVLGEMLELGAMSQQLHRQLGAHAAAAGVDALIGIHGDARLMVEEAVASGIPAKRALFFETPVEAGRFLRAFVRPGDTVLFKGSRGTRVEAALAAMEAQS